MGIQVVYAKDTLLYAIRSVLQPGWESLSVSADTMGQIEKVSGFIYYPHQALGRVLLVDSISLMRYRAKNDTTQVAADSVSQKQSVASRTLQPRSSVRLKANP